MTADDRETPGRTRLASALSYGGFLVAGGLVHHFQRPLFRFDRFLYNDSGADLVAPGFAARGLRPTLDFGYIYGLLPLEVNRLWYGPAPTPGAFGTLMGLLLVVFLLGLGRFVQKARAGVLGVGLLVIALPDLLQTRGIVLVHMLEPVLLVLALGFHSSGQRRWALALVTVDLFVKPSMAYVYGLFLVVSIVSRGAWRDLLPAALTGLGLAAWLGGVYGFDVLFRTLFPGAGLAVYRVNQYGFFREQGRAFWLIPGGSLRDYFRYEVGGWLLGTFVLAVGGAAALLSRMRRGDQDDPVAEVVACCAGMHLAFVLGFYGQRMSWVYYYAILVCGLAAMAGRGGRRWTLALALVAIATAVGVRSKVLETARLGKAAVPLAEGSALPEERDEWAKVKALAAEFGPAALLSRCEGGAVLEPDIFLAPEVLYLVPGHPAPAEIERKARQLARARTVVRVRPRGDASRGGYEQQWPPIARALEGLQTVWEGEFYEVARRP